MPRIARPAKDPATEADLLAAIVPIRKAVTDRWTDRPDLDPEPDAVRHEAMLQEVARGGGSVRVKDRLISLVRPRGEVLPPVHVREMVGHSRTGRPARPGEATSKLTAW